MTIIFKTGDIFSDDSEALVNTVNCVGVMGKGIALGVKKKYPKCFEEYRKDCANRVVRVGKMTVFKNTESTSHVKFIINFPTKKHWYNNSEIEWVESGLDSFVIEVKRLGIKSIAIPPLGCGNGGLDWNIVKPLIVSKLSKINDVDFIIYEPKLF